MISRILNKIEYLRGIYARQKAADCMCRNHRVRLYNWSMPFEQDMWLVDFIESRGLLRNKPKAWIGLYSVFGPMWATYYDKSDLRVFVDRENLHKEKFQSWLHRCLDDTRFDLSLGFDRIEHPKYLRFPFWLMWTVFPPTVTYKMVSDFVKKSNMWSNNPDRRKYCAYVCSHDDTNRRRIYEEFLTIDGIDCPGRLFHNDDSLKSCYNDDKIRYLQNYKFNLTPENSDSEDYVTEKLFEAIAAGCIPIYNGSHNNPEPDIVNREAIIFIKLGEDNGTACSMVAELHHNEKRYTEFASQPRFLPQAAERIWLYYEQLESRLKELIGNL